MTCEQAKSLVADSWQGELNGQAQLLLNQHLETCSECRAEAAELGAVWQGLASLPAPEPSRALDVRFEASLQELLAAESRKPAWSWSTFWLNLWPRNPAWQVAIAAACLLVGLFAGSLSPRASSKEEKEIGKLHQEIASTREMVALSLLQQQTATERLRGVEYSGDMKSMDPELVSALVRAINEDSSVNVRLAAIDALSKASASPLVRSSLARSLPEQDSPMVQAALVDYFVDAHDRQAVGALRQLTERTDLNPAVLEHTRLALRELSQ